MNDTKDTLKKKLNKSAQLLGKTFIEMGLGIKARNDFDDVLSQGKAINLEWATQGTQLTTKALAEAIESSDYKGSKEINEALSRYLEATKTFNEMHEPYRNLSVKLSTKRNNIYFIREETEQNAWRMAYFIKEMRMSELQKKHNETIDNEQMLLENLTPEDMQSIQQSYDHISIGLATIYAWQDLVKLLSEIFNNDRLTEAIETDAPSEAPIQSLRAEAGRTHDFLTNYAFKWNEHADLGQVTVDADIDAKIEYYKPLFIFKSLLDITRTNKKSYKKIVSAYADYTVEEITENIEKILADFTREIMKQNEGAE
ncbi:hypothetical protein HZY88_08485 [Aerococcaceae bacterium DSM 111176]|nr:hypothetical protein [Aerococcaceae bacterium DSM 111176]